MIIILLSDIIHSIDYFFLLACWTYSLFPLFFWSRDLREDPRELPELYLLAGFEAEFMPDVELLTS